MMEMLAPSYAALNVDGDADVDGDGVIVARQAVEGAPDRVEVVFAVGAQTVTLRFQVVGSPLGEVPSLPLAAGDPVHLRARVDRWFYEVTIRDPQGELVLLAARAPPEGRVEPAWTVSPGAVRRVDPYVTWRGVRLVVGGETVEIPGEGWHATTIGGRRFAVASEQVVAVPPSAIASALRFAVISAVGRSEAEGEGR